MSNTGLYRYSIEELHDIEERFLEELQTYQFEYRITKSPITKSHIESLKVDMDTLAGEIARREAEESK